MSFLWLSIQPLREEVRLSLAQGMRGTLLRARLPSPRAPGAFLLLLEALATWCGQPLCAVLDADAEDVRRRPEFWSLVVGLEDRPNIVVEWISVPHRAPRDQFLGDVPPDRRSKQLISFAASGQRS